MDTLGLMREFLAERLEIAGDKVVPEAKLADLGVDSLMFAEMLFEFEDRANTELNIPSADSLPATVGELIALIDAHIGGVVQGEGRGTAVSPPPSTH
ncbi:acyl carrier protein [bacterium BD-1]|nr:acyl carrier protein [Ottowia caeni]